MALGHPWTERARVGRGGSIGGAGSCAEVQGQARATVARVVLPGPTTEPPPPGRGHARPAGPRGGAGRQLDPAAIYGPFRRAGASSGRSLSRAPHNGAAAAVEPPPPRLEACTGAAAGPGRFRSPESVHPSFHSCSRPPVLPSIHSSVLHPSTHPPIHLIPPRTHPLPPMHPCSHASSPPLYSLPRTAALHSQHPSPRAAWSGWTTGTPRPDGAPAAAEAPRSSCAVRHPGLRRAGTASAAASGSSTQEPILLGSAQPYVKSASTQQPPAHSGAERPATANNRNSVHVYYGCEPGEKKKII